MKSLVRMAAAGVAVIASQAVALEAQSRASAREAGRDGPAVVSGVLSLTLDEALRMAVEGSREVEQARLQLAVARGQVSEAWAAVYPSIDVSGSYTRNVSPAVSFIPAIFFNPDAAEGELLKVQFGAENAWNTNVAFEQPLFRASALLGPGAANRYESQQVEVVRGTEQEVVTRVRLLYYELLLAQEQMQLIERSVARVMQSLEETRALNRAGLVSDYDVLRLEVELANLEPDLRMVENEHRRLRRVLSTELDLDGDVPIEAAGSLAVLDLEEGATNGAENARLLELMGVGTAQLADPESIERLRGRAEEGNSLLRQAALNAELQNVQLRLEQSEYLPEVSLFATYDIQAQQDGRPDFFANSRQRGYARFVGVRVSLPVFTGFRRDARIDQMQASLRSARLQLDIAGDQLQDEFEGLLDQLEESRLRTRSQGLAVRQARRGFEIASAQYREGLGSQLELTDAEVALRQSEYNYAQAVFDYLSTRARIDQLVGEVPVPAGVGS
ncbi:MAG: TolC family protein [Gammaproteobacteria bacterium]|nr:TolC family protein [Gammaproteobacteria bacterium]MDE0248961.1 TolC family protein [Gammaproteobacteria bacterium]